MYSEQVKIDAKKAADYLREHGWCQGEMTNALGECCANGALLKVADHERMGAVIQAFYDVAGCRLVVHWNDATGRTKEEVIEVFERIANAPSA